jgi:hypothetical protein
MKNTEQITEELKKITKTIGGHDVRNLKLSILDQQQVIIGEMKFRSENIWHAEGVSWYLNGQWTGKDNYKWFNLKITTEIENY